MLRHGGLIVLLIGIAFLLISIVLDGWMVIELLRYTWNYPARSVSWPGIAAQVAQNWLLAAGLIFTGVTLMAHASRLHRDEARSVDGPESS